MKILFTDEFRKKFRKLPINIQNLYYKQETIFKEDWRDARLHAKKLKGEHMTIDHRKDIYRR